VHIFDYFIPDNEVAVFFEAADLLVAPYTGGTQSGAVKAAIGFGLPSVITDIISDSLVREITDLCRVVAANHPKSLASGILKAINQQKMDRHRIKLLFTKSWHDLVEEITRPEIL
jgi:glycosyltransferase involved in cell wall biosynthesis